MLHVESFRKLNKYNLLCCPYQVSCFTLLTLYNIKCVVSIEAIIRSSRYSFYALLYFTYACFNDKVDKATVGNGIHCSNLETETCLCMYINLYYKYI